MVGRGTGIPLYELMHRGDCMRLGEPDPMCKNGASPACPGSLSLRSRSSTVMTGVQHDTPSPQLVRYNDWRQVAVAAPGAFVPELPVSVVVPYYAQPEELGRTLAALEGQTYPRELFEVVVVDDGSPEALERPGSTPLDVKVVRQEDLGFGLARARNTGVRAAAHDILLFLDGDMLPEADWLAAHARWHHAVPDAVTIGLRTHVSVDGVDAETIRSRPGTLKELFKGRRVTPSWLESQLRGTGDLIPKTEDVSLLAIGANLGNRREFYELVGRFDESFTQWGEEDTEFGYRAYMRGGLLVPVREAFAWHQGLWEEGRAEKDRSLKLQQAKTAHLIAHREFRTGLTGRTFTVPQYVVTVRGDGLSADRLLEAVERVLSGPMHDLVVRLELPEGHAGRAWLERHLGPDPRVRVAPSRSALEEFPASAFHVTLPAGKRLHADVVRRLRAELGTAVVGRSEFPDGSRVSIVRAWALHRALRTPWEASDFGDVVTIPPRKLRAVPMSAGSTVRALRSSWDLLRAELSWVDGPGAAWRFVRWFGGTVSRRVLRCLRAALPLVPVRHEPSPRGGTDDFRALAVTIHRRLRRRIDGNGGGSVNALRDLAEQLAESAPTGGHRAVALDVLGALSNGEIEQALSMTTTAKRTPDLRAEKIVSRKYGYVWLCIPKVASRSIKTLLCEIDPDAEVIYGKSISDVHAAHPEAGGYFSFAFVRDPYRRAFSFYADKYLRPEDYKRRTFIDPYHGASPAFSFDDLCWWLTTPYGSDAFADRHWLSQSTQVVLDDGRWPDFIGRYENLDADFRTVCQRLDMPAHTLPRLNTMAGCEPTEEELQSVARVPDTHLTARNKALLRERYAEDFWLLNQLKE